MDLRIACAVAIAAALSPAWAEAPEAARQWMEDGRKVADQFVSQLRTDLQRELSLSGPLRGIIVCKFGAPELASTLSRKTGWRVTRVSLRTRNPALGLPDAWEHRVLTEWDQRVARGEKAEGLEFGEVVQEAGSSYFRYMKALPVTSTCLACHGPSASLSSEVRERLALEYPHDRGIGYSVGQVRGAVTIKRPL